MTIPLAKLSELGSRKSRAYLDVAYLGPRIPGSILEINHHSKSWFMNHALACYIQQIRYIYIILAYRCCATVYRLLCNQLRCCHYMLCRYIP